MTTAAFGHSRLFAQTQNRNLRSRRSRKTYICARLNVVTPFPGAGDAAETTRDLKQLKTITGAFSLLYISSSLVYTRSPCLVCSVCCSRNFICRMIIVVEF